MSKKYIEVKELYENSLRDIKNDSDILKTALSLAGYCYKLSFAEQLIIAVQKPDTKLVATYAAWSKNDCAVRKHSKGIAIPLKNGKLKYYFSSDDVVAKRGKDVPQAFVFKKEYEDRMIEKLSENISEFPRDAVTFGDKIMYLANQMAADISSDIVSEIQENEDKIYNFSELDSLYKNVEKSVASIYAYEVMERLGVDTEFYETTGRIDFRLLKELPDSATTIICSSATKEAGDLIQTVAREVAQIEQENILKMSQVETVEIQEEKILEEETHPEKETEEQHSEEKSELTFAEQVDKSLSGELPFYSALKVCDTPQILLDVGCEQLPMLYTQKHLKDALAEKEFDNIHKHGLEIEQIKMLPELLLSPVMIYDSLSRNDSIVAVTSEIDKDDLPIVVSIKPNGKGRYDLETIDSNFITSIHGRDNFITQFNHAIKQDKLLFCNKEKSQELFERWGLQLPELTKALDFNKIIHQSNNISKSFSEKNEKIPTITCEMSESAVFTAGKTYSVYEFDKLMRDADAAHVKGKSEAISYYGSEDAWYDAAFESSSNYLSDENKKFAEFLGYDKTFFIVNMPDGGSFKERQDIGDGDGGVIEFLEQSGYTECAEMLRASLKKEAPEYYTKYYENDEEIKSDDLSQFETKEENYVINAAEEIERTNKEKLLANINAIKTLKKLESEPEIPATKEEKDILAAYSGWGGLSDVFDENKGYKNEREELKELLTNDEYESARRSTLDSFYTSPVIIDAIYNKLSDMGVNKGSLLEPSCGVGNFIGKIPSDMNLDVTGVELDSLSGRISSKLYPEANIQIKGFQKTDFKDNTFDVAVGNVPFGETVIRSDAKYKNDGLMIHDYFFVKSLDKLKDGGIAAFITSSGTLDKKNQSARELMSKKAEFLGAVRLPDNAFKNSGTTVTTDIIFLQKKDVPDISADKSWLTTGTNETGISMNQYFINHPEQIIGNMEIESSRFGFKPVCKAPDVGSISEMLQEALKNINGKISVNRSVPMEEKLSEPDYIIDYFARNFSFLVNDGKIYYKGADEKCYPALKKGKPFNKQDTERAAGMCKLRDIYDRLIDFQSIYDSDESQIESIQKELSEAYSDFTGKFGRINLKENRDIFQDDDKYFNLSALEVYEDDKFIRLSDVFSKRVIDPVPDITYAETSHDALAASLNRKGMIDISYMAFLTGKQEDEVISDLKDSEIFLNPENMKYESADEYLSGNVRKKLADAERAAADNPDLFNGNVDALQLSQPKDLTAADISVRLGSTWISPEYIKKFINENLGISERELGIGRFANFSWSKPSVSVEYQPITGEWNISGKHSVHNNIIDDTYGVISSTGYSKKNALDLLENALNLKTPPKLYKEKEVPDDAKKQQECQIKTDNLQSLFKDWIFNDYDRRTDLEHTYNEMFNNRVERHFDGSGLTFDGMNKNITLKDHQKDAVARQIYGGNTLLAHCVGAGKTFTMAAAAMEMKRIGICKKPMFVVPKAVLLQWQNEFKTLYPASNILTIRPEEFSSAKRKLLTAKIAAGDYDAVIVTHDMFEKIKLTDQNRMEYMQQEIDEIMEFLENSDEKGSWSVKRAEKKKEELTEKMEALEESMKDGKDDVLCFENLGVDHLFVDEAHHYKNLSIQTQMSNVAGINTHGAKKSDDMYYKCRYLNDLTDCKGITFATGTPISNSMTELYVNMKYLQPDVLAEMGCKQFDQWAANFGQCVTAMEFDPTGTSMRVKTRFASFFNMPELMTAFAEAADIQTGDKLKLPVPEAETIVVGVDPSPFQKDAIESLTQRIDDIEQGKVEPKEDNMLKVTTDGRKIAFDQRMFDLDVEENPNSKINNCINIAMEIYEKGKDTKTAQIIFSDLGVPQKKKNGEKPKAFDAYNDIKDKLIKSGVPEKEIALIHDYQTDKSKLVLSEKMRKGDIRFLIGSTEKCGTGLNVQNKLAAVHHLDVPWRPSDIEQREGRIIRQGNENKNVKIYRYVTKGSFDTYSWQIIEQKQRYVSQLMNCDPHLRKIEDVDTAVLSAAQAKSISSGDPRFEEKASLERDVRNLEMEETIYLKNRYNAEKSVNRDIPDKLLRAEKSLHGQLKDKRTATANSFKSADDFIITIKGKDYTDKKSAGEAIIAYAKQNISQISSHGQSGENIGNYRGFALNVNYNFAMKMHEVTLVGKFSHTSTGLSESGIGQIQRLDNTLDAIEKNINHIEGQISGYEEEIKKLQEILEKPFTKREELEEKREYLKELTKEIEADLSEKNKDKSSKTKEPEEISDEPEEISDIRIKEDVPIHEAEQNAKKEAANYIEEDSNDVKAEVEEKEFIVTESKLEENDKAEKPVESEVSNETTKEEESKKMSQSETKENTIPVSDARKMKFSNFKLSLCEEGDTDTDCKYKFTADTEKNKGLIITVTDNKKDIEQWAKAHCITYKDETKSLRSIIKEKQQLANQKSEDKKNEKQTSTPIVGAKATHGSNSPMNK